MKFSKPYPVKELASLCGGEVIGNGEVLIYGMNEIHKVTDGDLIFVDNEKYFQKCLSSIASTILINKKIDPPANKVLIYHEQPFDAYNFLAWHFRPFIHISESISGSAQIDPAVTIEPGVIIGPYVTIGAGSYIQANTYIGAYSEIGQNVIIQPGSLIGIDAFYFNKQKNEYRKWHSIGRVIIQDDVEIGAGSTIAKGVSGDTIIGKGSKLDAQVHIGHGVVIGHHCLLAAQVAIGGKTIIGDQVVIYGQAGIAQNLIIGAKSIISAKAGVSKDLEGNNTYFGIPALPSREAYKQLVSLRNLSS